MGLFSLDRFDGLALNTALTLRPEALDREGPAVRARRVEWEVYS